MKHLSILLVFLLMVFASCSPKINSTIFIDTPRTPFAGEIPIFTLSEKIPGNAINFGQIEFNSRLDFECTTDLLIQELLKEAREKGANAIKIFDYFASGEMCPDVKAYLLRLPNPENYQDKSHTILYRKDKAVIHFYRRSYADLKTQFKAYSIRINSDSEFKLKNKSKVTLVVEPGIHTFILNDNPTGISKNFEAGKTYFVKVNIENTYDNTSFSPKPAINEVNTLNGIIEFESFKTRKNQSFYYTNLQAYNQDRLIEDATILQEMEQNIIQHSSFEDHIFLNERKANLVSELPTPDQATEKRDTLRVNTDEQLAIGFNEEVNSASAYPYNTKVYVGFNTSPLRFRNGQISASPEGFQEVDYTFEPKNIAGGINAGAITGGEKNFGYVEASYLFSTKVDGRGRDSAFEFSMGYLRKLTFLNAHSLYFGAGIGLNNLERDLPSSTREDVVLRRQSFLLTPSIRYEFQFPKSKFGLFMQAKYIYLIGSASGSTGLFYMFDDSSDEEYRRFGFNSSAVEADKTARLNYGDRFQFSIGLFMNLFN